MGREYPPGTGSVGPLVPLLIGDHNAWFLHESRTPRGDYGIPGNMM
jgi:hypothetical protein